MPSSDFRLRFVGEYKGDIKDPVLTTLLDTLDAYLKDVQTQSLLSAYAQRSDQISDGFFEILRRHLFGQMFPGPAFAAAQASLREVRTAQPLLLTSDHSFSLQDQEGNKVLFTPQGACWVVPSYSNDVRIQASGADLLIGAGVVADSLRQVPDGLVSLFVADVDPLAIERLRCRLERERPSSGSSRAPVRSRYPGIFSAIDGFFETPFETRFIKVPFGTFVEEGKNDDGVVWLTLPGLGDLAPQLERKVTLNAFAMWNMVREQAIPVPLDNYRFTMPIADHTTKETMIVSAFDFGTEPPTEYADASSVMDPGYPFQFSASVNNRRDEIILSCSPPPTGDLKVTVVRYDLGEACTNIAAGRTFGLYQGIDERIKTVSSLTPTHRLHALTDKQLVWNTFRSLLASRRRTLTREDLRSAVAGYPPFGGKVRVVASDEIRFAEKVGRVNGFLTPYTEIVIPVHGTQLLNAVERPYFERQLEQYLRRRTVHGNFLRVLLVSAD